MRRTLVALVGVAMLASACAQSDPPDTSDGQITTVSTPTYAVPDDTCPANYGVGLVLTTDTQAEVEYLDRIVACTTSDQSSTYLKNLSDAVWRLKNLSDTDGTATEWEAGASASAFREALSVPDVLLVPGGEITSDLAPADLQWEIDLNLSVAWQGHEIVLEQLESMGRTAVVDALNRKTRAGAALAECTFTLWTYASTVDGLENADMSDVVLAGLGAGNATNRCRQASQAVYVTNGAGQLDQLSTQLDGLAKEGAVLERIETRLSFASRAWRVLTFGLMARRG